jgi:hypothetical protein
MMMSRSTETATFFTVFSPMARCRTTFEQTVAELTLVRVDKDATLVDRIGALIDAVVDDAARLGAVMHALQSQSSRQLSRSNFGRWRRLRQMVVDSLRAQLDLVLDACDCALLLFDRSDAREAIRRLNVLTRLVARLYAAGLVDAQLVHYCFNRLISGWLDPNTWQPAVYKRTRCAACDDAALECAMYLLATTGPLLLRDDRGGDEQRRLRARVPHYFDVVLVRVCAKLGARHRLSAVVKRVLTAKRMFSI